MLQQGIMLLDRFCQEDRIQIRQPRRNHKDGPGRSSPGLFLAESRLLNGDRDRRGVRDATARASYGQFVGIQ